MKPTTEQIERYIKAADAELGPECCDDYVKAIRVYLREWVNSKGADGASLADGMRTSAKDASPKGSGHSPVIPLETRYVVAGGAGGGGGVDAVCMGGNLSWPPGKY